MMSNLIPSVKLNLEKRLSVKQINDFVTAKISPQQCDIVSCFPGEVTDEVVTPKSS